MSKKNNRKEDTKKEIMELLNLSFEEEEEDIIKDKKEQYVERENSKQAKKNIDKNFNEIDTGSEGGEQKIKDEPKNNNDKEEIPNIKEIVDTIINEDIPNISDNEDENEEEGEHEEEADEEEKVNNINLNIEEHEKLKDNNFINQKGDKKNEKNIKDGNLNNESNPFIKVQNNLEINKEDIDIHNSNLKSNSDKSKNAEKLPCSPKKNSIENLPWINDIFIEKENIIY